MLVLTIQLVMHVTPSHGNVHFGSGRVGSGRWRRREAHQPACATDDVDVQAAAMLQAHRDPIGAALGSSHGSYPVPLPVPQAIPFLRSCTVGLPESCSLPGLLVADGSGRGCIFWFVCGTHKQ